MWEGEDPKQGRPGSESAWRLGGPSSQRALGEAGLSAGTGLINLESPPGSVILCPLSDYGSLLHIQPPLAHESSLLLLKPEPA